MGKVRHNTRPPCPTNAHPAPHEAKPHASYSIRQRLTKRGTLFPRHFSQRQRDVKVFTSSER